MTEYAGTDFVDLDSDYTLDHFQDDALRFARYPKKGHFEGLLYSVLALCGESGELANKLKKHMRDGEDKPIPEEVLMDELSDVLWYVAAVAKELGYDLQQVAEFNIKKLRARAKQKENERIAKIRADFKPGQDNFYPEHLTVTLSQDQADAFKSYQG